MLYECLYHTPIENVYHAIYYYLNFMFNFIFHGDDIEIKSKKWNENKNTEKYGVKLTGVIVLLCGWQIFKQINIGKI